MKTVESQPITLINTEGLGSGISCSKVDHDRYHNGDGTQVTDSEAQGESATVITSEEVGQQYSEFLRSLGVAAEDAARNARYLCDPEALAERSETERTIDADEADSKPDGNGALINGQSILARQVAAAKAMVMTMAQTTASRSKAELSHVAQNASSRSEVIFRRR